MNLLTTSLLKKVAGGAWPVPSTQSTDGKGDFMVDIGNKYFGPLTQVTPSGTGAPISSPAVAPSLTQPTATPSPSQSGSTESPAKKPRLG